MSEISDHSASLILVQFLMEEVYLWVHSWGEHNEPYEQYHFPNDEYYAQRDQHKVNCRVCCQLPPSLYWLGDVHWNWHKVRVQILSQISEQQGNEHKGVYGLLPFREFSKEGSFTLKQELDNLEKPWEQGTQRSNNHNLKEFDQLNVKRLLYRITTTLL